jgi:hypothetical protein
MAFSISFNIFTPFSPKVVATGAGNSDKNGVQAQNVSENGRKI